MSRILKWAAALILGFGILALAFWAWAIHVPRVSLATTGTLYRDSIRVDGRPRFFTHYLPPKLPADAPLLLVLHGSGMDAAKMRRMTGNAFEGIADREGFVVAYPEGYGGVWNDCRTLGDYESRRLGINDVAFMSALVDWFAREHGSARNRVFAAGISNGGQMAYRLGLEAPQLASGIAAVAANLPVGFAPRCVAAGRAVAALIINGTDDPINPYAGGEVQLLGRFHRRGRVASAMTTARYWAGLAGLQGEPSRKLLPNPDPHDGTVSTRWTWSGSGGPQVVLIGVQGGGHTMPHPQVAFPRILGRTSHDFSAAEQIWTFFKQKRR